jgi:hypothetical protein
VDREHVHVDVRVLLEVAPAQPALKRLLASVQPNVVHHVRRVVRLVAAKSAEQESTLRQRLVSRPNANDASPPQLDRLINMEEKEAPLPQPYYTFHLGNDGCFAWRGTRPLFRLLSQLLGVKHRKSLRATIFGCVV